MNSSLVRTPSLFVSILSKIRSVRCFGVSALMSVIAVPSMLYIACKMYSTGNQKANLFNRYDSVIQLKVCNSRLLV